MILKYVIRFMLLALTIGFNSCVSYYYYPTNQNVLKFKEKGDANIAGGLDAHDYFCYNLGYSITDNVAVITDIKTFDTYSSGPSGKYKIDDFLWDTELVVYKEYQDNIYTAVNFGFGFGQIDRNEDYYKLNIYRQFIQPSIGFSNNYFDFALSGKFARVNYDLIQLRDFDIYTSQSFENYFDFHDVGKSDFYFLEPAITLGVGYKSFKLRYQHILVTKLSSANINYISQNGYLTLNMTFKIIQLIRQVETNQPR